MIDTSNASNSILYKIPILCYAILFIRNNRIVYIKVLETLLHIRSPTFPGMFSQTFSTYTGVGTL